MSKSLDERQVALVGKWFPDWDYGYNQAEYVFSGYCRQGWYVGIGSEGGIDWQSQYQPARDEALAEAEEAALAECPEEEREEEGE